MVKIFLSKFSQSTLLLSTLIFEGFNGFREGRMEKNEARRFMVYSYVENIDHKSLEKK
jgi:hypothetical protein